jgi:hypothetical protein
MEVPLLSVFQNIYHCTEHNKTQLIFILVQAEGFFFASLGTELCEGCVSTPTDKQGSFKIHP